jgi:hypothetical protein
MIKLIRENISTIIFLISACSISLAQEISDVKIGIVHSELTKQLLYKNDNSFYPILDWELFFLNKKLSYSVIEDHDLESDNFNEFDVLILPNVEILSDDAIENLREFIRSRKSILVFGKLGSFNPQMKTRIPDALEDLTGFKTTELPVKGKISENVSFLSPNFLIQDLIEKPKFLILNNFNPLFAEKVPLQSDIIGIYELLENDLKPLIGAAAIEDEKGKILWFGFQLSQISLGEGNKPFFDQIILNGINWLAGNPMVWVNRFPEFNTSATIFSNWVENINSALKKTVPIFKEENVPVNFFITPSEINKSFDEIHKLSSAGSINLLFDEFNYLNFDSSQIEFVLEETSRILKSSSRQEYFGVQNLNSTNMNYNKLKIKKYFDFILSPKLKFFYLNSQEKLISFQGITHNFINKPGDLIESDNLNNQQIVNDFYENLSKTSGVVSHIIMDNSSFNFNKSIKETLRLLINFAKVNNSYITTYPELINWLKIKNNVEVDLIDVKDEAMIKLNVKNIGNVIAEQIGLNISVPSKYRTLKLHGYDFELNYNSETAYYYLLIPFLQSQRTITLMIEYEK